VCKDDLVNEIISGEHRRKKSLKMTCRVVIPEHDGNPSGRREPTNESFRKKQDCLGNPVFWSFRGMSHRWPVNIDVKLAGEQGIVCQMSFCDFILLLSAWNRR
jgi:hypothetical protein